MIYAYVCVPVCVSIATIYKHVQCLWRPEEGIITPGTGVTHDCGLLLWVLETEAGSSAIGVNIF